MTKTNPRLFFRKQSNKRLKSKGLLRENRILRQTDQRSVKQKKASVLFSKSSQISYC
jgi:hypothetical protein